MVGTHAEGCGLGRSLGLAAEAAQQVHPGLFLPVQGAEVDCQLSEEHVECSSDMVKAEECRHTIPGAAGPVLW